MPDRHADFSLSPPWSQAVSLLALTALIVLSGCGPEPEIRQYTVPELASDDGPQDGANAAGPAKQQSMLGAIVLAGPSAWFFKATGEPAAIEAHREAIQAFLRSITFSADGKPPTWELPEGWKQRPGDSFRYATLEVGPSPPLDLAVSQLPRGENDEEYILQNVNRWRGQLGLSETTSEQLAMESERFVIGEFPCTLVELTGSGSRTMGGPFSSAPFAGEPFSGGGLPKDPPMESTNAGPPPPPRTKSARLTYDVPEGWKELAASSFRQASFEVVAEGQKADVSVTSLSLRAPNAGDLAANVNRWRGMIGLPEQSEEEIAKSASEVKGDATWQVVHLSGQDAAGQPQAILAAMTTTADAAWFVKLTAPPPLAENQRPHFEQFVGSIKFN